MLRLHPHGLGLLICLLSATTACSQTAPPENGPPAAYHMELGLDEQFSAPSINRALWSSNFLALPARDAPVDARTLYGNGEREAYLDKDFLGLNIDPFAIRDGVLTITAAPLSDSARKRLMENVMHGSHRGIPALNRLAYSSGMITTRRRFAQQYGYFEARMRWTTGQGIWPAFWLLPADGKWPPEIDIMEALGQQPSVVYSTVHWRDVINHQNAKMVPIAGTGADFHTYGLLWLPERAEFYVDGVKTVTMPTTPDMARPMYPVINLAIGGYWPKDPDATTPMPARLDVKFIRVWKFAQESQPTSAPPAH
jgi:hypothetical protein